MTFTRGEGRSSDRFVTLFGPVRSRPRAPRPECFLGIAASRRGLPCQRDWRGLATESGRLRQAPPGSNPTDETHSGRHEHTACDMSNSSRALYTLMDSRSPLLAYRGYRRLLRPPRAVRRRRVDQYVEIDIVTDAAQLNQFDVKILSDEGAKRRSSGAWRLERLEHEPSIGHKRRQSSQGQTERHG